MSKVVNRRRFIQTSLTTAVAFSMSAARGNFLTGEPYVEAVVIGSGFGGAVASLRLGEAGIETVVLERGRRWPITAAGDTFCTKENPDGRAAWLSSKTILPDPIPNLPIEVFTGVLDRTIGNGVIAYRGAGVGGGSLMYGGITYQPSRELFNRVFPSTLSYDELDRVYYPRVRSMLKATPIPDDIFQTDAYLSSRILVEQAAKAGLSSIKPDIAFDWSIVRQEIAGQKVPSIIAGEVYYGTNSGAKNSLDRNYLSMAEETGYVEIKPLHVVTSIEESDRGGYQVLANQINEQGTVVAQKSFACRYLFLAAGSLGTPELLLRAQANRTLGRLNDAVGKFWGTNSESTTVMVNGIQTNISLGSPGVIAIQDLNNPIAPLILETFQAEPIPQGVIAVLGQGISKPEGYFTYNRETHSADLFWPSGSADSHRNAQALAYTYGLLNQANGTSLAAPIDQLNTGHPVGGVVLGAACSSYGEVYGYRNLFVVDGSLIPGSTACANPSLTIAALAEQIMDRFLNLSERS
jgi:cholesterol oxidase